MVSFLEFFCDSSRAVSTTHHRLKQHWMNDLIVDSGRKYRVKYSSFSSTSNRCARACKYSAHCSQWHPASILLNVKGSSASDLSQAATKSRVYPSSRQCFSTLQRLSRACLFAAIDVGRGKTELGAVTIARHIEKILVLQISSFPLLGQSQLGCSAHATSKKTLLSSLHSTRIRLLALHWVSETCISD